MSEPSKWDTDGVGVTAMREVLDFLEDQFLKYSDEGCDGTVYGCIGCDAKRLSIELKRFADEIEWIETPREERKNSGTNT